MSSILVGASTVNFCGHEDDSERGPNLLHLTQKCLSVKQTPESESENVISQHSLHFMNDTKLAIRELLPPITVSWTAINKRTCSNSLQSLGEVGKHLC